MRYKILYFLHSSRNETSRFSLWSVYWKLKGAVAFSSVQGSSTPSWALPLLGLCSARDRLKAAHLLVSSHDAPRTRKTVTQRLHFFRLLSRPRDSVLSAENNSWGLYFNCIFQFLYCLLKLNFMSSRKQNIWGYFYQHIHLNYMLYIALSKSKPSCHCV
jgi:hypothetical protein